MVLNNHYLVIKILTKAFTVYTKVLRKYVGFYETYIITFKHFLSTLVISKCEIDTPDN